MRIFFFFFVLFDNSPLPARYQHKLITRASRSLPARSAASEAAKLSEACFELGFKPACEAKIGTLDPRTTFVGRGFPFSVDNSPA